MNSGENCDNVEDRVFQQYKFEAELRELVGFDLSTVISTQEVSSRIKDLEL